MHSSFSNKEGLDLHIIPTAGAMIQIDGSTPKIRGVTSAVNLRRLTKDTGLHSTVFNTAAWKGLFRSAGSGTYTFSVYTTDTVLLYINQDATSRQQMDMALVHVPHGGLNGTGSIVLEANKEYPFYVALHRKNAGAPTELGISCITPDGQIVSDFSGFWYAEK